jgi:hypothetical protein
MQTLAFLQHVSIPSLYNLTLRILLLWIFLLSCSTIQRTTTTTTNAWSMIRTNPSIPYNKLVVCKYKNHYYLESRFPPNRNVVMLFLSTKTNSYDDDYASFAATLDKDASEQQQLGTKTTWKAQKNSNNNNNNIGNKTWQADLEKLFDPTISLSQRQILISDLMNANAEIRDSVNTAVRERKVNECGFVMLCIVCYIYGTCTVEMSVSIYCSLFMTVGGFCFVSFSLRSLTSIVIVLSHSFFAIKNTDRFVINTDGTKTSRWYACSSTSNTNRYITLPDHFRW